MGSEMCIRDSCRPVHLEPGNVYIGNLCAIGHQVMHEDDQQQVDTHKGFNVAIMLRLAFPIEEAADAKSGLRDLQRSGRAASSS